MRGHARLAGERRVLVTDKAGITTTLTCAARPWLFARVAELTIPDIPGLAEEISPWTNREAVSAKIVRGVWQFSAVELSPVKWRPRGNNLELRGDHAHRAQCARLIPKFESFAGELLSVAFGQRGINVLTDATVQRVDSQRDGVACIVLNNEQIILADKVLVATGRKARTEELGLETVGLRPGSWLEVDDAMQVKGVTGNWLYTQRGDVNHRALLTHMGKYQARVCGDVIAARAKGNPEAVCARRMDKVFREAADNWAVPQVVLFPTRKSPRLA